MAADIYLKFDGIDGESTDQKHTKWIEVLSFSHGVTQSASASVNSAGGRSAGRTDHADFSFNKQLDISSPKLNQFCSAGTLIKKVEVSLNRAIGDKTEYMNYIMEGVMISNVSVSGGGGDIPMESVGLSYGKISWKYQPTDHDSGAKVGAAVPTFWDLKENVKG